jgi:hypothetical protein
MHAGGESGVLNGRIVFTPMGCDVSRVKDGTEAVVPLGYEFECPTRYDRLFSGLVVPAALLATPIPGAGHIRHEHIYYRAEDGSVDFGEILRRVFERENRTEVASQDPPTWNQITEFLRAMQRLRDSAGFAA